MGSDILESCSARRREINNGCCNDCKSSHIQLGSVLFPNIPTLYSEKSFLSSLASSLSNKVFSFECDDVRNQYRKKYELLLLCVIVGFLKF